MPKRAHRCKACLQLKTCGCRLVCLGELVTLAGPVSQAMACTAQPTAASTALAAVWAPILSSPAASGAGEASAQLPAQHKAAQELWQQHAQACMALVVQLLEAAQQVRLAINQFAVRHSAQHRWTWRCAQTCTGLSCDLPLAKLTGAVSRRQQAAGAGSRPQARQAQRRRLLQSTAWEPACWPGRLVRCAACEPAQPAGCPA